MFDEQPDGDPHGECAAEIHRLTDLVRWAYAKLHHINFTKQDDALRLDEMKLLLEHGARESLVFPEPGAEEFVRMLLWDTFPECCGCPVEDYGGEYMGQREVVQSCCGNPEPALLSDAQIVASLRERFPAPADEEDDCSRSSGHHFDGGKCIYCLAPDPDGVQAVSPAADQQSNGGANG